VDRLGRIRGVHRRWLTTVAVGALALASPAGAATRATRPAASPSGGTSPALAAPTGAPSPAAPARATPAAEVQEAGAELPIDRTWRFGPVLGIESGIGDADFDGLTFRIDAERDVSRLSPETTLSLVGSLSLTHASGKKNVAVVVDPFSGRTVTGTVAWDANVFELVPTARLTYQARPGFAFVADGGVGLGWTAARARPSVAIAASSPGDPVDGGAGGVVRLAGGLVITPTPGLRIALEALALRLRFGNGPGSGFGLALSISHRL
jgi:hypothetical protein